MICLIGFEGGAPEILSVILEGESLFNDASSLTMFEVIVAILSPSYYQTIWDELLTCPIPLG